MLGSVSFIVCVLCVLCFVERVILSVLLLYLCHWVKTHLQLNDDDDDDNAHQAIAVYRDILAKGAADSES
jgi:uncharacterized membrane protein